LKLEELALYSLLSGNPNFWSTLDLWQRAPEGGRGWLYRPERPTWAHGSN